MNEVQQQKATSGFSQAQESEPIVGKDSLKLDRWIWKMTRKLSSLGLWNIYYIFCMFSVHSSTTGVFKGLSMYKVNKGILGVRYRNQKGYLEWGIKFIKWERNEVSKMRRGHAMGYMKKVRWGQRSASERGSLTFRAVVVLVELTVLRLLLPAEQVEGGIPIWWNGRRPPHH